MTSTLLELLVAIALALPAHEAGHYVAARALGGRDVRVSRAGLLGASVEATFADGARVRRALFLLGGALGNLAVLALALACGAPLAAGIHGAFAALMLVPTRGSDGAGLLSLVENRR